MLRFSKAVWGGEEEADGAPRVPRGAIPPPEQRDCSRIMEQKFGHLNLFLFLWQTFPSDHEVLLNELLDSASKCSLGLIQLCLERHFLISLKIDAN